MNHITLAVTDLERSFRFYHEILGLGFLKRWDKGAYFLLGVSRDELETLRKEIDDSRIAFDVVSASISNPAQKIIASRVKNILANYPKAFWFCLNLDVHCRPDPSYTHYAFTVAPEDFGDFVARLKAAGCKAFQENRSPGDSFYFCDPDGHKLEIHAGSWHDRLA